MGSSGALWLLFILVAIIASISFLATMRRDGAERYGLFFFYSKQFGLLTFGAIFLYIVGILASANDGDGGSVAVAVCTSLVTAGIALTMNIKRSDGLFGTFYTLAQAIVAYSVFLVVVLAVFKKADSEL